MPCSYCSKPKVLSKGLCSACYYHQKRHGTLVRKERVKSVCNVMGCNSYVVSKGLCDKHRIRRDSHGDTSKTLRPDDWGKRTSHPLYKLWNGLVRRCTAETSKDYVEYGARGIRVCDEWLDFWKFIEDMGDRPSQKHSVERLDVNGNYEKSNCVWATPAQQARNKRSNVLTQDFAKEIRQRFSAGERVSDIARSLALPYDSTRDVVTGRTWS